MVQGIKIYVGHPSSINYREDLYRPLKQSELASKHELVFPHEDSGDQFDSESFLRDEADLMVAEVSEPSTGLGIELGWADINNVPVIFIYREGSEISGSLDVISDRIISYRNSNEMIESLQEEIKDL